MEGKAKVLEVRDLRTYFKVDDGMLKAVEGVSFSVERQKTLAVIGESGCGKSVTALSVLNIVPAPGRIAGGAVLFSPEGSATVDLATLPPDGEQMRSIRGKSITMIFQEPMTSLSPVHTIGNQIMESLLLHVTRDKADARERAQAMLARVGVPDPKRMMQSYPYELSGGLCQRAMIAMSLSCNPVLLFADEPTTALDVSVQAQILQLMQELMGSLGMSLVYISHNLAVVSEIADEVAVMYLGRIVEQAPRAAIFSRPLHPYTVHLLRSVPHIGPKTRARLSTIRGTVPVPLNLPWRCGFCDRCSQATQAAGCSVAVPALTEVEAGHTVRCFLHSKEVENSDG